MALLTSARFRGDTTFGFLTRIFSTFLGGGVGLCGEYTIISIKGFYQLFVSLTPRYICAPTKGHQASPYVLGAIFARSPSNDTNAPPSPKEIVGEPYHIQGIGPGGLELGTTRREGVPLESRTSTRM
ncbi:hypothetical protein HHX47_DHR4001045 [Lentinula edodes]|nr:hypothetical protein HHX47_DHR4001045 [Lentinula edodes]